VVRVLAALLVVAAAQAEAPAAPPVPEERPAPEQASAPAEPAAEREPPAKAAVPRRPAPPGGAPPSASDRVQAAAAARRFLEALVSHRAADVAALCANSFSFDGRSVSGLDAIRSRFSEILAARDGAGDALLDLAVLPAAEAVARLGKPPKRIAGLVGAGTWIAVADVSGRPVVVVFARQGGGFVATALQG